MTITMWSNAVTNAISNKLVHVLDFYAHPEQLYITSAADGDHGTGSYHYGAPYNGVPCWAIDIGAGGVTPTGNVQMRDVAKWLYDNFSDLIVELIHSTPFADDQGFYVKNGVKYPGGGPYGDPSNPNSIAAKHLNHVHLAATSALADKILARAGGTPAPAPTGAPVTIFFPDVSHYQAGLRIQPGTAAVIAKATEGTTYLDASYQDFKTQAANVGAVFAGYHYLHAGNTAAQAAFCYRVVGKTPIMLDVEAGSGGVTDVLGFVNSFRALGGTCNLVYLPHWYWQYTLGSPSLIPLVNAGLKLVSSNYTTYSDSGPGWAGYGGETVVEWQYTDALWYGGQSVDFNAFKGTPTEFRAILYGTTQGAYEMNLDDVVPNSGIGDGSKPRTVGQILADLELGQDPYTGRWQNETLNNTRDILKALKALASTPAPAATVDVAALADAVAAKLVATHEVLSDADHAAIVADVRSVFQDAGVA